MLFLRYSLAGGMATAVHYVVLMALVEFAGLPAASSSVVGAICGAIAAYAINRRMTFTQTTASHQQALPRFMLIAALGAAVNGGLVWSGVNLLGWHYLVAQALATLVVLGLTYRLNRLWTFAL